MVFDVYLADSFKGAAVANYTEEWLEFDSPGDVVDLLTEVRDPSRVKAVLAQRVLGESLQSDGIKLQVSRPIFRVTIELPPDLLQSRQQTLSDRVPDPENKFSVEQRFLTAASGEVDDSVSGALTHRTLASVGKSRALVDGTMVKDQDYILTEASIGSIIGDIDYTAGFLETPGRTFANSLQYLGIGFSTAEDIFTDSEAYRGSKLEIFVPYRSRVEFRRGDRLLDSQVLDFGLQEIDTRNFPQGSYRVDITIISDNGSTSTDSRFFTKSGLLGMRDHPVFSFALGEQRSEMDWQDQLVYQGGIRWRAADFLQTNVNVDGLESTALFSLETLGIYDEFILGLEYSHSNHADSALRVQFDGSIADFSFNFLGEKTLTGFADELNPDWVAPGLPGMPTPTPAPGDPIDGLRAPASMSLLPTAHEAYSGRVSNRFGSFELSWVGNLNKTEGTDERRATGPRISWDILQDASNLIRLYATALRTDQGDQAEAYLMYQLRLGRWTTDATVTVRRQDSNNEQALRTGINYDTKLSSGKGTRVRATTEQLSRDSSEESSLESTHTLEADYAGSYLGTEMFLNNHEAQDGASTAFGLTAKTSFMLSQSGDLGMAPILGNDAIFVARLESTSTNSPVEVVVNGQVYETIPVGAKAVIPLGAYRVYDVTIRPTEDADLISYDSDTFRFALFPGNIVSKTWHVEKVFIALGRLVNENGSAVPWKRLRGAKETVITEEDGSFQAEITGNEILRVESEKLRCTLQLPPYQAGQAVVDFGDVPCIQDQGQPTATLSSDLKEEAATQPAAEAEAQLISQSESGPSVDPLEIEMTKGGPDESAKQGLTQGQTILADTRTTGTAAGPELVTTSQSDQPALASNLAHGGQDNTQAKPDMDIQIRGIESNVATQTTSPPRLPSLTPEDVRSTLPIPETAPVAMPGIEVQQSVQAAVVTDVPPDLPDHNLAETLSGPATPVTEALNTASVGLESPLLAASDANGSVAALDHQRAIERAPTPLPESVGELDEIATSEITSPSTEAAEPYPAQETRPAIGLLAEDQPPSLSIPETEETLPPEPVAESEAAPTRAEDGFSIEKMGAGLAAAFAEKLEEPIPTEEPAHAPSLGLEPGRYDPGLDAPVIELLEPPTPSEPRISGPAGAAETAPALQAPPLNEQGGSAPRAQDIIPKLPLAVDMEDSVPQPVLEIRQRAYPDENLRALPTPPGE